MDSEKLVTWLLRINAAILLMALPTIFLPVSLMNQIHGWLGLGEFPDQPISVYLARSCSALYATHGAILMLIAIAPRRHWSLIGPLAILHFLLGAVLLFTDLTAPMPFFWTALEGGPIMAYGAVLYFLWKRASTKKSS